MGREADKMQLRVVVEETLEVSGLDKLDPVIEALMEIFPIASKEVERWRGEVLNSAIDATTDIAFSIITEAKVDYVGAATGYGEPEQPHAGFIEVEFDEVFGVGHRSFPLMSLIRGCREWNEREAGIANMKALKSFCDEEIAYYEGELS